MTILKTWFNQSTTQETPTPSMTRKREFGADVIRMIDLTPTDPLVMYFQSVNGAVDIETLKFESPMLKALRQSGAKLVMPLVSQGELVGLLNLGPRMSEQDYSTDDRGLLNNLASQAGPAVRVAQLVEQQKKEVQERERIEQELRVARLIQQTLLPKELPSLDEWDVAAYYQPARAVGGDFYDFINLSDGRLAIVIGDVTDKGVPAALVMATTRAILRGAAGRMSTPGAVLESANDLLCPDIPPKMFVTCFYAILDPKTGKLRYANAGHDLPNVHTSHGVKELRATGMPLGLMPGMGYEEKEIDLAVDDSVVFYSDGLVEAHNAKREMFGFPRFSQLVGEHAGGAKMIPFLLDELKKFVAPDWEQEDDVTLVTLQRLSVAEEWRTLARFSLPSEPGNERMAMKQVADAIASVPLDSACIEKLKTAVAEATMNAIEHGNKNHAELDVHIDVRLSNDALAVRITDQGGEAVIPEAQTPDLEAKLAGLQSPRGWGLFLIKNLVDEMNVTTDGPHHTVELVMHLKGGKNG